MAKVKIVAAPQQTLHITRQTAVPLDVYYARGEQGAPGKSAYDVAVDNGFVGTEQQWLDNISATPELDAHVASQTPHPAYDDLPSLTLLFENGIV